MPATGVAEPGEILVFRYPGNMQKDFIKRVVAVAGDTVKVIDDTLFVNGEPSPFASEYQDPFYPNPLDYCWPECLEDRAVRRGIPDLAYDELSRGVVIDGEGEPAYIVPAGHVFMMGDNRDHSNDSRFWGAVPYGLVEGTPWFVYFSMDDDYIVRWDRIGKTPSDLEEPDYLDKAVTERIEQDKNDHGLY